MKKILLLATALALMAALVSGCAMIPLLYTRTAKTGANEMPEREEYVLTEEAEMGVYDDMYAAGMPMGTMQPMQMYGMYAPMPDFNTEEYAAIAENGFEAVATSPLSTFSADVDTASYCNLRRMLNHGYAPDEIPDGAVRVEEMLNYFRYSYDVPEGDERFAVTARLAPCPWNANNVLLMLGVQAATLPDATAEGSNLVFLVDVSGSMDDVDKLDLVKQALTLLTDRLGETDTVSIVTYSDGERVVIDGANPIRDRAKLLSAIDSLAAGGYTDGQRGLEQAYDVALRHYRKGGNNRVIMCSDGDLNVGITSESDLHDYVSEKKETGVYLSVLGFGEGNYKDTKMETLADDGNGSYYYIDSILEAEKVLGEELTQTLYAVADDVKFQVEFNPAKVSAYRQVGYENRALADQDFEDDAKDAGEVGAGASVTVLYELVPGQAEADDGGLRYQTRQLTEAGAGGEWLNVSLRYKLPGAAESQLRQFPVTDDDLLDAPDGDMAFAAAVAEFGMVLRDSEYRGDSSYETVVDLLKQAPLSDPYREEFFSLVKIAERADKLAK